MELTFLRNLWKVFLKGLTALVPLGITLALLIWIYNSIEVIFSYLIIKILGPEYYFHGLGVLIGFIFVLMVGIIMNAWIVQKVSSWGESLLKRIPLVKTLYGSVRDLMSFFGSSNQQMGGGVVIANWNGMKVLGLVTRKRFDELPQGIGQTEQEIAVYVPMSYQFGGFTFIVSVSQVTYIDMSIEEALRFAVTAGMLNKEGQSVVSK